jgi:hypothetical protein
MSDIEEGVLKHCPLVAGSQTRAFPITSHSEPLGSGNPE